jgi:hypothetical protein
VLPDMTLAQYHILTMIGRSPQRAGRLAERATMSKSALTGLSTASPLAAGCGIEIEGDRRGVGLGSPTQERRRSGWRSKRSWSGCGTISASSTPPTTRRRSTTLSMRRARRRLAGQAVMRPRLMSTAVGRPTPGRSSPPHHRAAGSNVSAPTSRPPVADLHRRRRVVVAKWWWR